MRRSAATAAGSVARTASSGGGTRSAATQVGVEVDARCNGRNLLLAAQRGFSQSIGLELSPALVALSRLRLWLAQINGTVHRADVLTAALPAEASVVYLYLSREALETLAPRLACAYHSRGTLVLSRDFELPDWSPPFERLERGPTTLLAYNASDASDACVE